MSYVGKTASTATSKVCEAHALETETSHGAWKLREVVTTQRFERPDLGGYNSERGTAALIAVPLFVLERTSEEAEGVARAELDRIIWKIDERDGAVQAARTELETEKKRAAKEEKDLRANEKNAMEAAERHLSQLTAYKAEADKWREEAHVRGLKLGKLTRVLGEERIAELIERAGGI